MGDIIFTTFFITFGAMCVVTPVKMLNYRAGLAKDAKREYEGYRILLIRNAGTLFIIVGIMLIIGLVM
jgi:hypothetical protein